MEGWTKRTLFNLGVALVILAVFFHFIGIGEIIKAFRSAKLPFALIGFVSGFGMVLGWIAIWRMVYNLTGYTFNLKELFEIYFAGNFANNITPFGQAGGEPFIAYIMSKKTDLSFSKSFAGVMCADVLRGVPYLVLSFLGLALFVSFYPMNGFLRLISVLLLVFCTLLVAAFSLLWFRREIAESVIIGFTSRLKRLLDSLKIFKSFQKRLDPGYVVDKLEAFYAAMEDVFSSRKDVIEVMGTAFFALFLGMLSLYSFSVAVNGVPSFAAIMFILPVSMVASYLPLPGGIGSIDLVMISLLYFLTPLSFAEGSAAVILFRFTTFILPLVIGGIATLRMSIDISKAMVESETS